MLIFFCEIFRKTIEKSISLLSSFSGTDFQLRPCPIKGQEGLSEAIAKIRIMYPEREVLNDSPTIVEVNFERKKITRCLCGRGTVYSGTHYALILREAFPHLFKDLKQRPVVIVPEYLATFQHKEKRWHLRYAVFSFPVLISLRGIVEAPARPRRYYAHKSMGLQDHEMPEEIRNKFLTLEDPRFPAALASIILQAWFFYETGYPFCEDRSCCLYNSHWQEDLISASDSSPYLLCPKHEKILLEGK